MENKVVSMFSVGICRRAEITGTTRYARFALSGTKTPFKTTYTVILERLGDPFRIEGTKVRKAELQGSAQKVYTDSELVIDTMVRAFPNLGPQYSELKVSLREHIEEIAYAIGDR